MPDKKEEKKVDKNNPKVKAAIAGAAAAYATAGVSLRCCVNNIINAGPSGNGKSSAVKLTAAAAAPIAIGVLTSYFVNKGIKDSEAEKAAKALMETQKDEAFNQAFEDVYN